MDKVTAKRLSKEIETAVKEIAARYGVDMEVAGGNFNTIEYNLKLYGTIRQTDGNSGDKAFFDMYCRYYGVRPDAYGRTFVSGGRTFKVVRLTQRKTKYCVLAFCERDRKTYKFTPSMVNELLARVSE